MSPSKKKQTPIRIHDRIRARLDAYVARTGLSINAVVNLALDAYLPADDTPRPAPPPSDGDDLATFD